MTAWPKHALICLVTCICYYVVSLLYTAFLKAPTLIFKTFMLETTFTNQDQRNCFDFPLKMPMQFQAPT